MEYSSKTKQILLTVIVLVIVAFIAYVIFFLNIKEKNNSISLLTNEVDSVLQKEIKLRSVKQIIKDTKDDRVKLDSYFVADDEIINFIEMIETLGVNSGAEVEVINVSVDTENEKVVNKNKISELLNINFKTEGSFVEMFHFLSMLEKLPFKIEISQVNFNKVSNEIIGADKSLEPWKGYFNITAVKLK
ncbi:MAG: type 4a pilus biogenesis protein PilO [Candidatus Paceibacteria bacterium]